MNLEALIQLVGQGESEHLEFKRSTGQRSDAAKTVCAMLNGLGGFVLFGVTDRGDIIGQQLSARTIEEVVNEVRRIEPPVFESSPQVISTTAPPRWSTGDVARLRNEASPVPASIA